MFIAKVYASGFLVNYCKEIAARLSRKKGCQEIESLSLLTLAVCAATKNERRSKNDEER
jgi:hypothetical protein